MTPINQNQKRNFLILVVLSKRQITILKLLKQRLKFLIYISNLATKTALTTVENKIPSLVKKRDYDTKITEIENKLNNHNHDKYITTPEFNTVAFDVFYARLAKANLITKTDFDSKLSRINRKITENKTKKFTC